VSSFGGTRVAHADPRAALQARSDVGRALLTIAEPKRVAFLMAEVEGLTCPEIAATLGVPIGTVWTRLHAARRELRRALEVDEP
jgi:RNA polymerase sigma-70 factor, ECF subfamily